MTHALATNSVSQLLCGRDHRKFRCMRCNLPGNPACHRVVGCSGRLHMNLRRRLGIQQRPSLQAKEAAGDFNGRRRKPGHEDANTKRKSLLNGSRPGESGAADPAGCANFEERRGRVARPFGAAGNFGLNSRVDASAQCGKALRPSGNLAGPDSCAADCCRA